MKKGLVVFLAAAAMIAVAVFEGSRTNRWGTAEDIQLASKKLDKIPREVGNWVGTDAPIDEKILRVAEASGNVSRNYVNRKNGEVITVLLLCGPTGPIGAHTPEYCFTGIGYQCKGKPTRKGIANEGHTSFWTARFEKVSDERLTNIPRKVYWAWSTNGDWQAASNARSEFAWQKVLYKLQLERVDNSTKDREPGQDPIDLFLADFLPVVKTALNTDQG